MLANLQNMATLIATAVGIYVAVGGLWSWRRETTGKRDIELCQMVIEKFYEAEHKISVLRSPMSYVDEGESRKPEPNESEAEADRRNFLFVPLARFNQQFEFWSEFLAYKFRMRALFGDEAAEAFNMVDQSLRSFRAAAITRYQALYRNPNGLNAESSRHFEETIWEGLAENDPLSLNIKNAIIRMEAICIPIVRSSNKPSLSRRLGRRISFVWFNGLAGI